MSRRRIPFPVFLGINIAVSIITTLLVLLTWDARRQPQPLVMPTFSGISSEVTPDGAAVPADLTGDATGTPETADTGGGEGEDVTGDTVPEPTLNPEYVVHIVQTGELMGQIAELYGVSVEDIVIATGLDNPDVLDVGQELIIPIGGLPPEAFLSPTPPQATPTVQLAPISTVTSLPPGTILMVIQEVLSPGDVTSEAIVISNQGAALDLGGWTLADEHGNEYVFPSFRLFGNGASVVVHTGIGEDSATDLYWGLSTPVWGESSDTVILRNPSGEVQTEFPIEQ